MVTALVEVSVVGNVAEVEALDFVVSVVEDICKAEIDFVV